MDEPLRGLRVVDAATIYAGPLAAMMLGDYGADVIKLEHPRGDPMRSHGESKDGHGLWWKVISRNKRMTASLEISRFCAVARIIEGHPTPTGPARHRRSANLKVGGHPCDRACDAAEIGRIAPS